MVLARSARNGDDQAQRSAHGRDRVSIDQHPAHGACGHTVSSTCWFQRRRRPWACQGSVSDFWTGRRSFSGCACDKFTHPVILAVLAGGFPTTLRPQPLSPPVHSLLTEHPVQIRLLYLRRKITWRNSRKKNSKSSCVGKVFRVSTRGRREPGLFVRTPTTRG